MGIWIKRLSFYELLCTWERVIMGKLVVQAYLSEHNTLIKSWSGTVDSMYKFSDYSSVQHAPCCRLHHLKKKKKQKTRKSKLKRRNGKKPKMIRRGGLQWGIHQARTGSQECVGKSNVFLGGVGVMLWCQCVVWSYCQRLCSLYNSWIDGGLFSGGLWRRWRRGFAGQRRWNGLQADKIVISTQEEKISGDKAASTHTLFSIRDLCRDQITTTSVSFKRQIIRLCCL